MDPATKVLIHLSTIGTLRGGYRCLYTTSGAQLHKQLGGSRNDNKLPQEQVINNKEQDLDIDKNTTLGISPNQWRGVDALDS